MAVFGDTYLTQPLLPMLGADYGVSASVAGLTISAVVLTIAAASLVYGPIADSLGRRRTMTAGAMLLACATAACAFAPNFWTLVALRAFQGLAIPAITAVAVVELGSLRGAADPGSAVGIYIGATVLGGLCGRVASGLIAAASTWRAPFIVYAIVTLVAALGLATLRDDGEPHRGFDAAGTIASMRRHLHNPSLLAAYAVAGTLFFGFVGTFTYLPYLLQAPPYQLSTGSVAWFFASYGAGVISAPLAGRLSRRIARRTLIIAGMAIALAGMLLTLVPGLVAIALGLVVVALGMFVAQAVAPAYVNVTAAHDKGAANSLYQCAYYVGGIFGATLPGLALERYGWSGVVGTCVVSLALGSIAAAVALRAEPAA